MTQPRCILPATTYLVTRRTLRRHHLLRPDVEMTNLLSYTLAVCATRYGIQVHAFCALSTHVHLVATDLHETMPAFLAQFHRLVALATKVFRGWEGSVWDGDQTSMVRLGTPEAVTEKIAYVLANPVAAGLVRSADDWPGAASRLSQLGGKGTRASRPKHYFDAKNRSWPEAATLEFALPGFVDAAGAEQFRADVAEALERHERAARQNVRHFVGAKGVVSSSPYQRTTSAELLRGRNPTFAVGGVRGAYEHASATLRAFRAAYRDALAIWRAGVRAVVFPAGTWWMARVHSVVVAA